MEWIPKSIDCIDSAVLALYQLWRGYYRWVFFRVVLTVAAVTAMIWSPSIRHFSIAVVTTYLLAGLLDRLVLRRKRTPVFRARG